MVDYQHDERLAAPHAVPRARSRPADPSDHVRSDHDELLRLQRAAGNGAVAGCLTARVPLAVQRVGTTPASDPTLVNQYNTMVAGSPTFSALNQRITANTNITLVDSTATQAVDYNSGTHTIQVPVLTAVGGPAHPLSRVREDLLWEMHNASNVGSLGRAWSKAPSPPVTMEDKRLLAARQAATALAVEWTEWIMIVEHDLRAAQVDMDLGGTAMAPAVDRMFQGQFAVPNAGWFLFANYLRDQVAAGHTASYDPAALAGAAGAGWKGWTMLTFVANSAPATLQITDKQVTDWVNGARTRMKSADNNPFASDAIAQKVG